MAISVNQLLEKFNINIKDKHIFKWDEDFKTKLEGGIYVVALTDDPNDVKPVNNKLSISKNVLNANEISIHDELVDDVKLSEYLNKFWNPNENILYIGKSKNVTKRVKQFYKHKLGNSGPHTGGHWLKLLSNICEAHVLCVKVENFDDMEFKLLMNFIELSSGKNFYELKNIGMHLPFANLTADFDKTHFLKINKSI